jgi:hypothetical protein
MQAWGRGSVLVGMCVAVAFGCGGRTGSLDWNDDGAGADGSGADGTGADGSGADGSGGRSTAGTNAVAGKPSRGGTSGVGGTGFAGAPPYAGAGGYATAGTFAGGTGGYYGGAGGYYGGAGGFGGVIDGGAAGAPADCQSCVYQSCSGELSECFSDFGCLSIFSCAIASGCQGLDCYSPDTCRNTIDQWGGPAGESMRRLLGGLACVVQSGCPCN